MWPNAGRYIPVVLLLGVAACTETPTVAPEPAQPELAVPQATVVTSTGCVYDNTVINAIGNGVSRFFKQPQQGQANTAFNALKSACSANNGAVASQEAQKILALVDVAYQASNIGQVAQGTPLVRNLLICAWTPCAGNLAFQLHEGLLGEALSSPRGLIAFRKGGTTPAVARGTVSFASNNFNARWGTVPAGGVAWPNLPDNNSAIGNNFIFIYGNQRGPAQPSGRQTSLEVKRWPTTGFVKEMVTGACFNASILSDPGETFRVSRAPVVGGPKHLAVFVEPPETFCDAPVAPTALQASIVAPVVAMTRSFRLTRLVVFNPSVRVGTGTPDWSVFTTEELVNHIALAMDKSFATPLVVGQTFNVPVTAKANLGTAEVPLVGATVTLSIFNNSGTSGGAELTLHNPDSGGSTGPATSVSKVTNAAGTADFVVSLGKAGGYILCTTAALNGYTFQEDCTQLFHVRNN